MNAEKIVNWPGRGASVLEHGTVRGESGGNYVVQGSAAGIGVATQAFSCLLKPAVGDRVLYTRDPEGGSYILSILDRPTGTDSVVSFPGDVLLDAGKGRVTLAAASGIDMSTASGVNLLASEINVAAAKGQFSIVDMQASGENFAGTVSRVRLFTDAMDVVAQRVTQRFKTYFRWVDEIEQASAGQMINKVRNLFSVRARQSAVTAQDDVKINGKRVHIG